ncbi:MAG: flagellar biosynthesis protein FlgA [Desulfobulbaceae bacterium A2]|nr:MAG: flagellar biosynthesis protein FlgA [Desulfobulbaceae bacterium A2]
MTYQTSLFRILVLGGLLLCGAVLVPPASATRVKDIADLEGVRENQLMGYGLVIGLNGTGDDVKKSLFTRQSIVNMIERLGITLESTDASKLKTENVAAVMVTAALPPFASPGSTLDVMVSSIGDASSLAGGSLLMTPLKAVDGKVYAVAQGPLTVGSISYGGKAAKVQKNHPTVGRITGGAVVERTANFTLPDNGTLTYHLKSPDFSSAAQMVARINEQYGPGTARAVDSGNIHVTPPTSFDNNVVKFVADLEHLDLVTDAPARIVVNERTGTIVMGKDVRISTVAVSHGNLNLVITESTAVSQPNPLAKGETVIVPQTTIKATEENGNLVVLEMGVSIGEIARALNAIGATPRDLIAIFQAMKAAGALHGELVVL